MNEEEKKKGEEPKRITRPKKSKQQKKKKKQKLDEKDKEVVDALTALGTPTVIPLKITSAEWVQPRRRRSNRIKSQKKEIQCQPLHSPSHPKWKRSRTLLVQNNKKKQRGRSLKRRQ
jgi:hypothetical protein